LALGRTRISFADSPVGEANNKNPGLASPGCGFFPCRGNHEARSFFVAFGDSALGEANNKNPSLPAVANGFIFSILALKQAWRSEGRELASLILR
jgi:hypothetical protein